MQPQNSNSSFDDLEKQLGRDALETALKELHGEIIIEIAKNKKSFSEEIKKTLDSFRQNLEKAVSEEIDQKLSVLMTENFSDISKHVKESFEKMFVPVLENTKNDMQRLHVQGESTLNSWADMMAQYKNIWTRPFFLLFAASILTGVIISFVSAYYLTRHLRETMKIQESMLISYKNTALYYFEREQTREKETGKKQQSNKKQ